MTPQEKYNTDPSLKRMVDMLEHLIHEATLAPTEIREAAMLACIHHEMNQPRVVLKDGNAVSALRELEHYRLTGNDREPHSRVYHLEYVDSETVRLTPKGE